MLQRDGSVFLEGIGLPGSGSVSEVDTIIFHAAGVLLGDSLDLNDFSGTLLELVEGGVDLPDGQAYKTYQNWEMAKSLFLPNTLMQTISGFGFCSVGSLLP